MQSLKLSTGFEMPMLGFGTYRNKGDDLEKALRYAIEIGYRHIDCAWFYDNEAIIGRVLKDVIEKSNGSLKREDFFIVSKVWNTHHSREMVRKCLSETLENLQLDYLDVYLVHFPMGFAYTDGKEPFPVDENGKPLYSDVSYIETYKAMEELMKEGKIKSIGLSDFTIPQIQDVLDNCEIKPANLQMEISPYLQCDKFLEFCKKNNIVISIYGVIGAGEVSNKAGVPFLLEHECLIKIGKKYGKTPAQICLRWGIQRNLVVLAKSTHESRIKENFEIFDFELSAEDMEEIKKLNMNLRSLRGFDKFKDHKYYPFHECDY